MPHQARRLLDNLADPNASEAEGWTPLHMASLNGHLETLPAGDVAGGFGSGCLARWGGFGIVWVGRGETAGL